MEQVTFIIEHKKDKSLLIAVAEKPGIKKYAVTKATNVVKKDKREDLLKIINAGVDVSNFGNPSLWQKETRKNIDHFIKILQTCSHLLLRKRQKMMVAWC